MSIDLEKTINDLSTRRTQIQRWYKLSPYQFERCELHIDSLLSETSKLISFIKDNFDQRDADMRQIIRDLPNSIAAINLLKQEMQDHKKRHDQTPQ